MRRLVPGHLFDVGASAAAIVLLSMAALWYIGWSVVPRISSAPFAWPMQHTLYYALSKPAVESIAPGGPIEVGVAFHPTVAGVVVGMRFYRLDGDSTAGDEGRLWTTDGRRLATVRFAPTEEQGWQDAWFPTPVRVPADIRLVVSRFSQTADAVLSTSFRERAGSPTRLSMPLFRALEMGGGAVNLYHSKGSGFPSIDAGPLGFWVDVLFVPDEIPR